MSGNVCWARSWLFLWWLLHYFKLNIMSVGAVAQSLGLPLSVWGVKRPASSMMEGDAAQDSTKAHTRVSRMGGGLAKYLARL